MRGLPLAGFIALCFAVADADHQSAAIAQQKQHPLKHMAPADKYFGRMKLSFLGINNTFMHEKIRAGAYTTDSGIINKVGFADEALREWAKTHQNDPHLPRSYYLASEMYKKIWTKEYQEKAWQYMQLLESKYSSTFFGKQVKKDLETGFTMHYFAEPVPCLPSLQGEISTALPSAHLAEAGKPKVQIHTPPCIPTPTPLQHQLPRLPQIPRRPRAALRFR